MEGCNNYFCVAASSNHVDFLKEWSKWWSIKNL